MPRDAVIENLVINSPFREPDRDFRFDRLRRLRATSDGGR